ncbi:MAG TPA: HIT domain-containing protein [Alphaproteobacteria bacterium]|nr:HIT domain-containing protein [Alphaproteobacteria bacterium]
MENCIFCKIVKGELPSTKVYEDENVLAFENIKPAAETHILIIPKKHIITFMDLDGEMESLVKASQKVVSDKQLGSGYKLVVNGGKYQTIPHFHLHLLAGELEEI